MASPQPEADLGGFAEYRLSDPVEIQSVLRDLSRRSALLAIFPEGDPARCHVGRAGAITPDGIELAVAGETLREPHILARVDSVAVAFLDQFKVQFTLDSPLAPRHCGGNVIRIGRPSVLYRIQRRNGFRIRPQPSQLAECHVRIDNKRVEPWKIIDLSVVGVALKLPAERDPPKAGTIWRSCVLRIDNMAAVPVDLVVAVVTVVSGPDEVSLTRVGCAFDRAPPDVQRLLQRTVIELELIERQARSSTPACS